MPTPSIQTLVTDAQQILNLDSISAVRSVVAVALANANTGTPLNPNLTTQQLWNEFYQVVNKPKSDIESIIANQLMKFLFAPPAPGGVGANGQVIFNDGGVLAGDPQFLWNKTTNLLTVTGSATITGDLTVRTTGLVVNSTGTGVQVSPSAPLCVKTRNSDSVGLRVLQSTGGTAGIQFTDDPVTADWGSILATSANVILRSNSFLQFQTGGATERMRIDTSGNVGVGVTPSAWNSNYNALDIGQNGTIAGRAGSSNTVDIASNGFRNTSGNWVYKLATSNTACRYQIDGSTGSHIWYTGSAGTAGNTIAGFSMALMTLDTSGNLLVGTTNTDPTLNRVNGTVIRGNAGILMRTPSGFSEFGLSVTSGIHVYFASDNGTSRVYGGNISTNGSTTAYNTTSDYRLKEYVQPLVGGLARVNALKPSVYKWKSDGLTGEGFLAHELAEIVPIAVTGEKDAVKKDGSIDAQGVDMSKLVPILVAAIQELTARVEALEA